MYPWLRFVKVLMTASRKPTLAAPDGTSIVHFRVWPTDLDQNMHLNNGRYLMLMDLGRYDLVARMGLLRIALRNKWYPVVHSATIRYRKPIGPWKSYQIETRIVGWDDRAFFLEQRFIRKGALHATGLVRGVFLGPNGRVTPETISAALGVTNKSPPLPESVTRWQHSLDTL